MWPQRGACHAVGRLVSPSHPYRDDSVKKQPRTYCALACALAAGLTSHTSPAVADETRSPSQVVVTATRGERSTFDTPQAVNVIGSRAIADGNVTTTPDALAGQAGILIQKSNTGGGSAFIRGLTGKQVLILVDGVRLNNSYYRFGPHQYLNTVDPGDLDRIEVVHGPGSVLYGSDALGGVVNLISKSGRYADGPGQLGGMLGIRSASADRSVAGRAEIEYASADLSIFAGASVKRFGDLRGGEGIGRQVPTAYDEQSGSLRVAYKLAPNHGLVFRQHILRQDNVPKTNEVLLGTKLKFDYQPQFNALGYVEYSATDVDAVVFDSVKLNLSNGRQKEGEEIIERAAPTIETRELTDVRTRGFSAQFRKRLGTSMQFIYGFERYRDRFDTGKQRLDLAAGTETAVAPGTPNGASYSTTGLYAQAEIQVGDSLQLVPGLRYSQFKASGRIQTTDLQLEDSDKTASLMGVVRLTEHLKWVGSIAQGYRAPNMEDFFGRVDFATEVPNTALVPESSLNREVGLKYERQGTAASVHYFVSTYEDLITRVTISPGVRQRQNLRKARIDGVEASASFRFGVGWAARVAVGHAQGQDTDTRSPLQRIPPLSGSALLRYNLSDSLWVAATSTFARRQDRLSPEDLTDRRIPPGGTPGYGVVDVSVGYQPARGQVLNLRLENIADKAYKTHGSGVYGAGLNLAVSYGLRL